MATRLRITHRASGKTLRAFARTHTFQAVAEGHTYTFEPRELEGRSLCYIVNEHLLPGFYLTKAGYGDSGGPYWLTHADFAVKIDVPEEAA